ncbi:uncharacterized protein LOC113521629 [Galleria mellonella]|uniref:Uncharacterized protein LOC113521629 n=1 Tax=Galleria mellonella TaxID=7137 RepID=A0A6J3C8G6_GALME|nr:uncharacterized protein LOC113521629 [Galleria mellonella]XP_031767304.2 uncharacterized protein LOC113521629 [Galleria mellonella]XP_052752606.1 uncharacterized protein LOC113521629 [Galleria mellonella]
MNTGDDEPSSGLNGRLRPRKSTVPSPQTTKAIRKTEGKIAQEKPKRTCTPSKVTIKPDDLSIKADSSPILHLLCPYCDRKFASKQTLSKHARRTHISTSKQESNLECLYCSYAETGSNHILRHMVESHPNQYFACLQCHTRFPSATELDEHKLNICEKQKIPYRNKLRQKASEGTTKKSQKSIKIDSKDFRNDAKTFTDAHGFNGVVISCELKPSQVHDEADIEDNITTNLILPPSKNLGNNTVIEKNAVIILDDIQWNKRIPSNFSFHNTDADQILSRLGVVHRSPRTGESTRKEWFRAIDDSTQKFEKCFDTTFYSKVASNVQENLTKFLDGSFNFNPDPDNTIKTRKSKNSVVINTAEGFPILLAYAQYSRNAFDGYMPRAIAPKHKWKWDSLESDRNSINPDQIKRDSHTNNCIITLVSSLDIWTQLRMRGKYEDKYNYSPLGKKTDKQNAIGKELKEILESREIPISSLNVVKHTAKPLENVDGLEFPASLGLTPSMPKYDMQPAVLSGEWVRPRCYVCCACGVPTYDSRSLSSHIATHHPNAQVQHYDVVGELLLNGDILKHLYVPPSQTYNRTRPLRGFRECTKCKKSVTLEDLHQHMLDCAGDTPTIRRKCRYRPFGVRRRRSRLPDNRIRKKMRKDIRNRQTRQKNHMRPRPRNRTEVGDAETIRKMLADLPAKRHRVMVNPMNSILRPRKKIDKQRNKLLLKRRSSEDPKSRKLRPLKNATNLQTGSTSSEDYKNMTSKDNDDKPLKSRLNRVTTKNTRQNDTMKRRTLINRTKRIPRLVEQSAILNKPEESSTQCSGSVQIDQLSIDNTSQRIDINNGPYNTREHSSRGGSNNREQQSSGSSNANGNSDNSCPQSQNAPLKHSIARLTADSETHDKSVQFHHLFLVQQECNNVNQHVPTGDRLFFENEAAVTRLDKPPLHFSQRNVIDPYGLQKSCKLNKPRKGLNDCIAMLKNKLEVPTTGVPPSQISVQCGSDDPLDSETGIIKSNLADSEHHIEIMKTKPAEIFSRHNLNLEKTYEYDNQIKYHCQKSSTTLCNNSSNNSVLDVNTSDHVMNQKTDKSKSKSSEIMPKCETIRTRSVSHPSNEISLRKECELVTPMVCTQKRNEVTTAISHNVDQSHGSSHQVILNIDTDMCKQQLNDSQKSKVSPRKMLEIHTAPVINKIKESLLSPQTTVNDVPVQQNQVEIYGQGQPMPQSQSELLPLNSCSLVQQQGASPLDTLSNPQRQIQNIQLSQCQEQAPKQSEIEQKTSSNCHNSNSSQHSPIDENTSTNTISVEVYSKAEYRQISSEIPPAHSSTNIESLVAVPLDLSGKVSNIESSDNLSKQDSSFVSNYDVYETLDLSSKNTDSSRTEMTVIPDVVVDLRIKTTPQFSHPTTLDLGSKNVTENVTDLSIRDREMYCVPTDLSIRGKSKCTNLHELRTNEQRYVQDLFGNKAISVQDSPLVEDIIVETPTDLSGKSTKDKIPLKEKEINYKVNTNKNANDNPIANLPNLSQNNDKEKQNDTLLKSPITIKENKKNCDKNVNKSVARTLDKISLQRPVYDPTLKIPQYKIRTTASTTSTYTEPIDITNSFQSSKLTEDPLVNITIAQSVPETKSQDAVFTDTLASVSISQERFSHELGETPLKVCVSTISTTIPIYTLSNPISTTPVSKYESTTPVYTLANACISVTKIERPSLIPLTSSLLSIPGTTIANTTSVYTLAGTTIGLPINYGATPNLSSQIAPSTTNNLSLPSFLGDDTILEMDNQKTVHNISPDTTVTIDKDFHKSNKIGSVSIDHDPETAKKIAMLPKELVEILGTMPAGHRNQLLNVLPQYVSNTVTTSILSSESTQITTTSTTMSKRSSSPTVTSTQIVADASSSANDSYNISQLNIVQPLSSKNLSMNQVNSQKSGSFDSDKKLSKSSAIVPKSLSPLSSKSSFDDVGTTQIKINRKIDEDTKTEVINVEDKDKIRLDHISGDSTNLLMTENVIDLTNDDSIMPAASVVKLADEFPRNIVVTSQESQAFISVTNSSKQKVPNEKTSSLRAVRKKAPSERLKSTIDTSINKPLLDLQIKCTTSDQEKETNKFLDSDKTMIIQQVEVSSTQLSTNKCDKFSVSILSDKSKLSHENLKIKSLCSPEKFAKQESVTITSNCSSDPISIESIEKNHPNTDACKSIAVDFAIENESVNETPLQKLNKSEVSEQIDIVINSNTDDKRFLEDTKGQSVTVTGRDKTQNMVPNSKIKTYEEDDSDDDISLAIIVKQKQEQFSNSVSKDSTLNVVAEKGLIERKKKKKDRKIKKVDKKAANIDILTEKCAPTAESLGDPALLKVIDNNTQGNICTGHEDIKETKVEAVIIEDKHCKRKTKKGRRNICGSEMVDQQIDKEITNPANVNKTHDIEFDKMDYTKCKENILMCKDADGSQESKTSMQPEDNNDKHMDVFDDFKMSNSIKVNDINLEEKPNMKNTESSTLKEKKKKKKSISVSVTTNEECSVIESKQEGKELKTNISIVLDKGDEITCENENKKSSLTCDQPIAVESCDTLNTSDISDPYNGLKTADNIITPLRRSRRGKSLFTDSEFADVDSMNLFLDTTLEQKTPLTKKQLIFSKLLLDEENTRAPAHSTPKKNVGIICIDETNIALCSNLASINNEIGSLSNIIEKSRSKRRQSPEVKCRNKKRKSLETSQFNAGDNTDKDNSHNLQEFSVKSDVLSNISDDVAQAHEKENVTLDTTLDKDQLSQKPLIVNVGPQIPPASNDGSDVNSNNTDRAEINSNKYSTEKRKITVSQEINQSPKPKKLKPSIKNVISDSKEQNDFVKNNTNFQHKIQASGSSDARTACYNLPAASRRTRSKSVVVKSSKALMYDPYDIDLDDMIEKSDRNRLDRYSAREKLDDQPVVTFQKCSIFKKSLEMNEVTVKKDTDNLLCQESGDTSKHNEIDEITAEKGNISDSDESSKSDVPLQKYVEEKERRISELESNEIPCSTTKDIDDDNDIDINEMSNDKSYNDTKKSRRTLAVCNNVESMAIQSDADELRSEQFMESFGFFSQRKPRKSNLLASKKISETFHIIANETDDMFFGFKERATKKSLQNENRKSVEGETNSKTPQHPSTKVNKTAKRGRKKKSCIKTVPRYCNICKKEFRRPDNYLRHQMTLLHISKLCEIEMKIKTAPVHEEPNYLIAYKQYLDRLKILTDKLAKKKKNKTAKKIKLPTVEEILADLNKTIREQQLSERGLSRDEALFLDCCELLKESHKNDHNNADNSGLTNIHPPQTSGLDLSEKPLNEEKYDAKSDGDVDSITAKNILESEEVRNLENDLISGLKEAANASLNSKMDYRNVITDQHLSSTEHQSESFSTPNLGESRFDPIEFQVTDKAEVTKTKKYPEYKEKMYPDIIEDIDMFEDKFDKIKRKSRSQAAAAKQTPIVTEPSVSHKGRKKSDKKKIKKSSKKNSKSTQVLTKGALKGFDGIKVSIPRSDINIATIVPPIEILTKKKKKTTSKKKRDKKDSESSNKYNCDHRCKTSSLSQKKVDVYEFMDNEDAELFEFRPSTLMERFKRDLPSTSKFNPVEDEIENSSESGSDGDDFVYMSDDYVCSDDETENSLMSCETGNIKVTSDKKNSSPLKRKDVVDKNAVMGKIFKHNAVRTEKKNVKNKDTTTKPKANLDQLFDSLLEDEPNSSMLKSGSMSPQNTESSKDFDQSKLLSVATFDDDKSATKDEFVLPKKFNTPSSHKYDSKMSLLSKKYGITPPKEFRYSSKKYSTSPKKYVSKEPIEAFGPSTSKRHEINLSTIDYGPSTSKQYDMTLLPKDYKASSPKKYNTTSTKKYETTSPVHGDSPRTSIHDDSIFEKLDSRHKSSVRAESGVSMGFEFCTDSLEQESLDDAGVARQRARRKCTVGKQNVLAESWSSESEPDGRPPRPSSAESVLGIARKRKGKKKEGQQSSGRKSNNKVTFKKQDIESRVTSSNRNTSISGAGSSGTSGTLAEEYSPRGNGVKGSGASSSVSTGVQVSLGPPGLPGPSAVKVRPRSTAYYWSSEGDEQEHLQQHGWIVGDSHKKLVTMLAHAKGRKRNNDDKRHFVD